MKANAQGFTLIEVLVSLAVGAIVMLAAAMAVSFLYNYTIEEGSVSSSGESFPLAPAASQTPKALTVQGFVADDGATSRWAMVTDEALDLTVPPAYDTVAALGSAPMEAITSPAAFRQFLKDQGAFTFSAHAGYAVFFFSSPVRISSLLNVEFWDEADTRFYVVSFYESITSAPSVRYAFCEPIKYAQNTPSFTRVDNVYQISIPDPGSPLALNAGRLERVSSDPAELTQAIANLDRSGSLTCIVPLQP